jgi:hypothetical protein
MNGGCRRTVVGCWNWRDNTHAVLAAAVEGFVRTPEMPEIAEAEALLDHLSNRDSGAA